MIHDPLHVVQRVLKVRDAHDDLIAFTEITMPDPKAPGDPNRSDYEAARHHRFLAEVYQRIERQTCKPFTIVNAPPSHGKTELGTRRLAAFILGRNPGKSIVVGSYNDAKAQDFKEEIRAIIESAEFRQVFPDVEVVAVKQDHLVLNTKSKAFFVGRGTALTGRHADWIIVDDPIKDDAEARSEVARQSLWKWWTTTLSTRGKREFVPVIVTQTRWTEDDLTGRLSDPTNPHFSKRRAELVEVINLPAMAEGDDPLGRAVGAPLWPERFGGGFLELKQEEDPVAFASLYQGRPAPAEGIFYTRDILDPSEYDRDEFPTGERLRYYGASDHAVSTARQNDLTCILPFGVDSNGCAWIMPDIAWDKMKSDVAVERIVALCKALKPLTWYSAKGAIDAAIGPFLRRRLVEESVYTPLQGFAEVSDKLQRAHSARARVAQGKIRFPVYASWWPRAKEQLLKFPNGKHADFADTLSLIGFAVDLLQVGMRIRQPKPEAKPGTFGAMMAEFRQQDLPVGRRGW